MNNSSQLLLTLCLTIQGIFISIGNAQIIDYAVSNIPIELLVSANAVVRYDKMVYTVDAESAKTRLKTAVTLLNQNSNIEAFYIPYDSNSKVKKIKCKLYDASGQLIRKIEKTEIQDRSYVSDFSIYEDNRYKKIEFSHNEYPYTVEYEYEREDKEVLFYPPWGFLSGYKTATQYSFFQLKLAEGIDVRYKVYNCDYQVKEGKEGSFKTLTWEEENIPAMNTEPYAPGATSILPMIAVMPKNIDVKGLSGDLSTWEDYGNFMYRLNENRDQLSPEMIKEVKAMTANAENNEDKIEILYRYVQDNMRYVSVQLGVGGWQTFDAQYVEKNKYGDCKALSNFMKSLLKAVDIQAYVALVYGGSAPPRLEEEFPSSNAFNHVILNIPEEDCWLECTSSRGPVNHTGRFTGNRQALLLTEEGGKLVETPGYTAEDNLQHSRAEIQLTAEGSAIVKNTINCYGMRYGRYNAGQEDLTEKELHQWFVRINDDLPTFEIQDLNVRTTKEKPESGLDYRLEIKRYAAKAGKRLFVPVNCLNAFAKVPAKVEKRRLPVVSRQIFTDLDEYRIHIPEGYEIESIPEKAIHLKTDFGIYELNIEQKGNILQYHRKLQILPVQLPAEKYEDFRTFYKQITKLEKMKVVLVK